MPALRYLKGLLWFIAVYQLAVGISLLVSPDSARLIVTLFGATVAWTPEFAFMLKPLGAYMLMTGVIAWGTARASVPHPMVTYALAVLFLINAAYRVLHFAGIQAMFGIPAALLVAQIATLLALAAGCLLLQRSVQRDAAAASR